jgi:hypothetical protein
MISTEYRPQYYAPLWVILKEHLSNIITTQFQSVIFAFIFSGAWWGFWYWWDKKAKEAFRRNVKNFREHWWNALTDVATIDVVTWQRLESAAACLTMTILYPRLYYPPGQSYIPGPTTLPQLVKKLWFLVPWLLPDLGILGYRVSDRLGALVYNTTHNIGFPLCLYGAYLRGAGDIFFPTAYFWLHRIFFNRAFGIGLRKQRYNETHLHSWDES